MKTRWFMVFFAGMLAGYLPTVHGQGAEPPTWPEFARTRGTNGVSTNVSASATGDVARVVRWGSSTGLSINVSGFNAGSVDITRGGTVILPATRGRNSYLTYSPNGGISIREAGGSGTTYVTPQDDGGLRIRTPDNRQFIATPDGRLRSVGIRSDRHIVTMSADGKSVTVWGRDGASYVIPLPGK